MLAAVSDEARLIEAIVEAPDDDAPRLVYADFLQTKGDPRGELIQLQCQLAAAPDDDRRRAIRIQENKLLAAHRDAWLAPLYALLRDATISYKFELRRGFVEHAEIGIRALPLLDRLIAVAPLLRSLRLFDDGTMEIPSKQPKLAGVLEQSAFRRMIHLEISLPGAGNAAAREVAGATTLANLRALKLQMSVWGEMLTYFKAPPAELVLDDVGATALAESPYLAKLESLDLDSNRIGLAGVFAIARGDWRLRELVLANNAMRAGDVLETKGLAAATLDVVLAGPALERLETLSLAGTTLDAKEIAGIVASPTFAQLRELDLERCHLGVAGITALCEAFALPALRRLRVERNSLCDAGALAVADCAALANLTSFEAGHNRIGQKGGTALATTPHFTNLERITLNEPRWKPEMTAVFASSPTLANAKIYLAGRLVSRKQTKAPVEGPAKKKPTKKSPAGPDKSTKPTAKRRAKRS